MRWQNLAYDQYAIEANPGTGIPSFPLFDTLEAAERSQQNLADMRPDLTVPRVLVRHVSAWEAVE